MNDGQAMTLTVKQARVIAPYADAAWKEVAEKTGKPVEIRQPLVSMIRDHALRDPSWSHGAVIEVRFKPDNDLDADSAAIFRGMLMRAIKTLRTRAGSDDVSHRETFVIYLTMTDDYLKTPAVERIAQIKE
jgi:hypothetical protein